MSSEVASNDDEYDIYSDLPNFHVTESITKLESKNKCLLEEKQKLVDTIEELQKMVEEYKNQKAELELKNRRLSFNMSSLFKTAASELKRKDRMIEDLRREHDNTVFRRRTVKNDKKQHEKRELERIRRLIREESESDTEAAPIQETEMHVSIENNAESGHKTQNEDDELETDTAVVPAKKYVPPYTGHKQVVNESVTDKSTKCTYNINKKHDNTVFRRRSVKNDKKQHEKRELERIRRLIREESDSDWELEEAAPIQETEMHVSIENNAESGHKTQNMDDELETDTAVVPAKKYVPPYTGPLTEFSKRIFAKLYGISVEEIVCEVKKTDCHVKEQKYKEISYKENNQHSETNECNESNTDDICKSETETNTPNRGKLITTLAVKTLAREKLKLPKSGSSSERKCSSLRERQHPTDYIKLGAQNVVKSEEKNTVREDTPIRGLNKPGTTPNKEVVKKQAKDVTVQENGSKVASPSTKSSANLQLDTGQEQEGSECIKQDKDRIKQLFHNSAKFLVKTKSNRSNKIVITPTTVYCDSKSTMAKETISSPDGVKQKPLNAKSSSVAVTPNSVNSNRKSRQAQLLASFLNSPEPKKVLRNDVKSNAATTQKTVKPILRPSISSIGKNSKAEITPPKRQLDDKPADSTPKRQMNLSADGEAKIPGDIITPILAKITESACKLPAVKNKNINQGVPVHMRKDQCPRIASEKLFHGVTENSCSIMGEDTLGMVTSLARTRQTVSPIKTPDKKGNVEKNSSTAGQEQLQKERKAPLNFSGINKSSLLQKGTETKSPLLSSSSPLVSRHQQNVVLKKPGVSVCVSSEHGEFKRKRSIRTPVTSETDEGSPEKRRRLEDHSNVGKLDRVSTKIRKISSSEGTEKINQCPNDKSKTAVQERMDNNRNRRLDETLILKTADCKHNDNKIETVENNSGKENNEEIETPQKHDGKSPIRKGRDSFSRRRLSRRCRYSPYRRRRRSPLRSFERNLRRRSPGYFRYSDRRRSHRSRSITPVRFRSRRSSTYSPIRLRSKRSVSLSPCRLLRSEKYHKHSKASDNKRTLKVRDKIKNSLSGDDVLDGHVDTKELENNTCRCQINKKQTLVKLSKSESHSNHVIIESNEVLDRLTVQKNKNIDNTSTSATKSPLSKEVKATVISDSDLCKESTQQKPGCEIQGAAGKSEKENTSLKNNVITCSPPELAATPSPVVVVKRRSRKVVRLEDSETTSTVSIKSPTKTSKVELQVNSETQGKVCERTTSVGNKIFSIIQEQNESVCAVATKNVNMDHENVRNEKSMESKVPENISDNDKEGDFVLTRENVRKLYDYYNKNKSSSKKPPKTSVEKENLYTALFGTPNSKCSSENTETEEGELSSSSDEGVHNAS